MVDVLDELTLALKVFAHIIECGELKPGMVVNFYFTVPELAKMEILSERYGSVKKAIVHLFSLAYAFLKDKDFGFVEIDGEEYFFWGKK